MKTNCPMEFETSTGRLDTVDVILLFQHFGYFFGEDFATKVFGHEATVGVDEIHCWDGRNIILGGNRGIGVADVGPLQFLGLDCFEPWLFLHVDGYTEDVEALVGIVGVDFLQIRDLGAAGSAP